MIKHQTRLLSQISVVIDASMIVAAFFVAYAIVSNFTHLGTWQSYDWILLILIPAILLLMGQFEMFTSLRTKHFTKVMANLFKVHIIATVILSATIFIIDPRGFSRLFFGGCIFLSLFFLSTARLAVKLILNYLRSRGFNLRRILIAGCNETSFELIRLIQKHPGWGLDIVGVAEETSVDEKVYCDVPVIGIIGDVLTYCESYPVDELIWCLEQGTAVQEHIYYHMLKIGITFHSVLGYSSRPTTRVDLSLFHGQFQILTFYGKEFNSSQLMLKRCIDIIGSLAGLAITALQFPFIAIAIRVESAGPIFFGQLRLGENGREFRCWKFRSMYVDAEERKKELLAQNEMKGAMFKIANDPRVTKVGNILRKTSIDELPQFWNVLRGEMSLVGTRPPTPDEVHGYKHWHRKRICIKPGITGLWQVSGRSKIKDFDEVADLDIRYIDTWSLWLDVEILVKTVWVIFARSGAS